MLEIEELREESRRLRSEAEKDRQVIERSNSEIGQLKKKLEEYPYYSLFFVRTLKHISWCSFVVC